MAQRKTLNNPTTGTGAITAVLGCFTYEENFTASIASARLATLEADNNIDRVHFDASKSNGIYGSATTIQPPSIALIPNLRY